MGVRAPGTLVDTSQWTGGMGKERTQDRARPAPYTTKEVQVLKHLPAAKDSDIEVVLEVMQQEGKGEEVWNGRKEKESGRGEKEKVRRSEEKKEEEPWKSEENPWRHIHFLEAGVSWGSN